MNKMKVMVLAASTAVLSLGAVTNAAAEDALALATQSGCMACHQIENKVVGPAYKEVAAKYKGEEGAVDMLAAKVKAGGSGVWGPIPMPPNVNVSDENAKKIVAWILTL